jgi:hypothetical protein
LLESTRAAVALRRAGVGSGLVVETILRAGQLAADHATLAAVDLNPVIATATRCVVTDAVIRVSARSTSSATVRRL